MVGSIALLGLKRDIMLDISNFSVGVTKKHLY